MNSQLIASSQPCLLDAGLPHLLDHACDRGRAERGAAAAGRANPTTFWPN